jgi:integrase
MRKAIRPDPVFEDLSGPGSDRSVTGSLPPPGRRRQAPGELTAKAVAAIGVPGRHRVARNLHLMVDDRRRSWVHLFICPLSGRPHEMGLGPAELVSLAEAKAAVLGYRAIEHAGRCPLCERRGRAVPKQVLFREVFDHYVKAHQASWRSASHRRQWDRLARQAAGLWNLPVAAIDVGAVMGVLQPHWQDQPVTYARVRGRLELLLDFARARGWREGENPARWKGHLAQLLPPPRKLALVVHHAALPWQDTPAFYRTLGADLPALAVKLLLLTAVRRGEALRATWAEIDREAAVWTIPASHTKANREHRVPLSAPALAVLETLAGLRRDDLLFPGAGPGRPLGAMSLRRHLPADGSTLHGFRASFRTWAAEAANARQDVAEAALGHVIKDAVVAAYQRGDLFALRAELMAQWARHLTGEAG